MESKYWIWLQCAFGEGVVTERFLRKYDNACQVYRDSADGRRQSGVFTPKQLERMEKIPLSEAEKIIEFCTAKRWNILTPNMANYPRRLLELQNFPLALYYVGQLPDIDREPLVAMVGARDATSYGLQMAQLLAGDIARAGVIVVSGGALGIDSQCHRAAIEAGGKTIAVLGNGFGANYLEKNKETWKSIARNGAVITELRPGTPASRFTFPMRNRIISGLSLGTVVVEANQKSGSLITAKCAGEQGRDVFAVPGEVLNTAFYGANKLIKDGAKPVFSANDILDEYRERFIGKIKRVSVGEFAQPIASPVQSPEKKAVTKPDKIREEVKKEKQPAPLTLSADAQRVYEFILPDVPISVDELIEKTGLPNRSVLVCLTELEMTGIVECLLGRKYITKA